MTMAIQNSERAIEVLRRPVYYNEESLAKTQAYEFRNNLLVKLKGLSDIPKRVIVTRPLKTDEELKALMLTTDNIYKPMRMKYDFYIDDAQG